MTETIPLSYLVRQQQLAAANQILLWFQDIKNWLPPSIGKLDVHAWTRDDQTIAEPDTGGKGWDWSLKYSFQAFDPASHYSWGQPKTVSDQIVAHPDQTLLLDNTGWGQAEEVDLTRSVDLKHQSTTSTESKISVDIGSKVGATLGGEAEGGSIEAEISTTLGIANTNRKDITDSTDESQSVSIKTKVPAHKALLATISSPQLIQDTPFSVDGLIDGPFAMGFNDGLAVNYFAQYMSGPRYSHAGGRHLIQFEGFDDFYNALRGYNVDFPGVVDAPLDYGHIPAVEAARRIQWTGNVRQVIESAATVRFQDVADPQQAIIDNSLPQDRIIKVSQHTAS